MTLFDWIALVGAAAWLPQIAGAIYRILTKPRITLIPVPGIEVGYTLLGPILNLKAALFAQQKDAIVIEMDVVLTHERGRTIQLHWNSFLEKFSEVRGSGGESVEVSRDQEATALKLSTLLPTEKFIRFQDPEFQEQIRLLSVAADAEVTRLKAANADPAPVILTLKSYSDLVSYYRHNFCWEAGRYGLELRIQLLERKSAAVARTEFRLTEADVEGLQRNLGLIEQRIRQIAENVPEEERVSPTHWALPRLGSKQVMVKT